MKRIIIALALVGTCAATARVYNLNSKRLDTNHLAISCANGADPTGTKAGGVLIISCTDERK